MGVQFLYPRLGHITAASVSFSNTGDNTLIAVVSGKRILVHRLWLVCGAATALIFKHGTTAFNGAISMGANGGITFDTTGEPWFVTAVDEAFVLNQSGTAAIGGMVYYTTSA